MNATRVIELALRLNNALFALQRTLTLNTDGEALKALISITLDLMDDLKRELEEALR